MIAISGTKGRFEGCELWGNACGGVLVCEGADPTLARCTIRDHAAAAGVHVTACAAGAFC